MARLGRIGVIIGLILTIVTVVAGFTSMFNDNDQLAQLMFMLVPFGFLVLFTGVATVVLFAPRENDKEN